MTPELFEVVLAKEDGYENLPKPEMPYYVVAQEGRYIHRKTQIGNVMLPVKNWNSVNELIGRVGYKEGVFVWEGEKIPAAIISQAHDFFKRIYQKHSTEAEVLITMHNETKAFRLFVPFQRVNGAAVKSVYEPTHIDPNYTVVGTIHSHCNFGAFHSGTDSGDASDMDGVHFTIGHVTSANPDIVAMVAMGGKEFHYKDPAEIAEIGGIGTITAPPWWDNYVFPHTAQAIKPKALKSLTQTQWDEFLGIISSKKSHGYTETPKPNGWVSPYQRASYENPNRWVPSQYQPTPQSRALPLPSVTRIHPERDWDNGPLLPGSQLSRESESFNRRAEILRRPKKEKRSKDILANKINEALDLAEAQHVFTDLDWLICSPEDFDDIEFWYHFFYERFKDVAAVLEKLGLGVKYEVFKKGQN